MDEFCKDDPLGPTVTVPGEVGWTAIAADAMAESAKKAKLFMMFVPIDVDKESTESTADLDWRWVVSAGASIPCARINFMSARMLRQ
jgi:hypothetical protein